jgi:hypothetical protein
MSISNSPNLINRVGDLPNHDFCVTRSMNVQLAVDEFQRNPDLPGVIIVEAKTWRCVGMISRAKCFEYLSRPFAREVYLRSTMDDFFEQIGFTPMILESTTRVDEAVRACLKRPQIQLYEPVLLHYPDQSIKLLDLHILLLAQSYLLETAYRLIQKEVV